MKDKLNILLVLVLLFNTMSNSYSSETNDNQSLCINTQDNICVNGTEIQNNNIVIENNNEINSDSEYDIESELDIPINKIKLFKDNHNNIIKKLKNASKICKRNYKNIKSKVNSTITELNDIADSIVFDHNNITSELHNYINHLIKLRENFILPTGRSYSRNTKSYKLGKTIKDCIYKSNKILLQITSLSTNEENIQSNSNFNYNCDDLYEELSPIQIFYHNHIYTLNALDNIINDLCYIKDIKNANNTQINSNQIIQIENNNYIEDIKKLVQRTIKQLMFMMGRIIQNYNNLDNDNDDWKIISQRKSYVQVLDELKESMKKYGIIENDIMKDIISNALITTKIIINIVIPD